MKIILKKEENNENQEEKRNVRQCKESREGKCFKNETEKGTQTKDKEIKELSYGRIKMRKEDEEKQK